MATVIAVTVLLVVGLGGTAHAATLTVVNTNDSGAGSLRQAIADAAPGDTIDFNAGLTGQTITLTTGELVISKNLTIAGPAGGVTVSGNHATRVFTVGAFGPIVTVNISNLTVSHGLNSVDPYGAGILNNEVILNLTNSTIIGNSGLFGGGIYSSFGAVTVTNSTISGNSGLGAIYSAVGTLNLTNSTVSGNSDEGIANGSGNTLTMINSTVSGNAGSGIGNGGTAYLTNSNVTGNSNTNDGGGIVNEGLLTLSNSAITGNSSYSFAGGIFNEGPSAELIITNSTVSGNSVNIGSGGAGGGIFNGQGSVIATNSTISSNSGAQGGGIFNFDGPLTLTNTIVASQAAGGDCYDHSNTITSVGYNLDSDGSCHLTSTGDLPHANPMLGALALNPPGNTQTQALQPGSPAIDHIPPGVNGCGTTVSADQRGVSRPQGSGCDIGAYELVPATPTPIRTPTPSPASVGGIVELLSGSDSPQLTATDPGSLPLHIALASGAALATLVGGWYVTRRRLR